MKLQRLLKLHKLFVPADEYGSDTGGTDTAMVELDGVDGDSQEDAGDAGQSADGDGAAAGEDDVVITIGEEVVAEDEEVARAPEWVRDLRKSNREKDRVIRDLQQKISASAPAQQAVTLGVKPTLATCDFDETKYETDLEAWHTRKREVEDQQRAKEDGDKKSRDAWQTKLADYGKAKTALKVSDFEEAEETVKETLNIMQQGIILQGLDKDAAARLTYALGKNPKKLKELAAIGDPVIYAVAIGELKTMLKVTPRKTAPVPERPLRGSAPISGSVDSQLERLRADAEKTGDYTKINQYKMQKRTAQK